MKVKNINIKKKVPSGVCPYCSHDIPLIEPFGKCHNCNQNISWHPDIEFLNNLGFNRFETLSALRYEGNIFNSKVSLIFSNGELKHFNAQSTDNKSPVSINIFNEAIREYKSKWNEEYGQQNIQLLFCAYVYMLKHGDKECFNTPSDEELVIIDEFIEKYGDMVNDIPDHFNRCVYTSFETIAKVHFKLFDNNNAKMVARPKEKKIDGIKSIQFDGFNWADCYAFASEEPILTPQYIADFDSIMISDFEQKYGSTYHTVKRGEYILEDERGLFKVYSRNMFEELFERMQG